MEGMHYQRWIQLVHTISSSNHCKAQEVPVKEINRFKYHPISTVEPDFWV